jgi:hypothetical protein
MATREGQPYFGSAGPVAYEASLAEDDGSSGACAAPPIASQAVSATTGTTITGRWERLDDEKNWMPWMEITLTRDAN